MAWTRTRGLSSRGAVLWYLLGAVVFQIGVGVAVERAKTAVRDPEFAQSAARLAARRAEAPTRPLMLVLGSSRTSMGFDPGLVARADGEALVYNMSSLGAGPVLEQVELRRLLDDGVRPDFVVIEVVPMCLASNKVVPIEDTALDPSRLSWKELRRSAQYYRYPIHAYAQWLKTRGLVCVSLNSKRGVHDVLRIDTPLFEKPESPDVAGLGFSPNITPPLEERIAGIQVGVERYGPRLAVSRLAEGPARAVRDLIGVCRSEHIPYAVLLMPECSKLRELHPPAFRADVEQYLAQLQAEDPFELIDARTWVADDGFWDVHHLHVEGARAFSERFAAEALPRLRGKYGRGREFVRR